MVLSLVPVEVVLSRLVARVMELVALAARVKSVIWISVTSPVVGTVERSVPASSAAFRAS